MAESLDLNQPSDPSEPGVSDSLFDADVSTSDPLAQAEADAILADLQGGGLGDSAELSPGTSLPLDGQPTDAFAYFPGGPTDYIPPYLEPFYNYVGAVYPDSISSATSSPDGTNDTGVVSDQPPEPTA